MSKREESKRETARAPRTPPSPLAGEGWGEGSTRRGDQRLIAISRWRGTPLPIPLPQGEREAFHRRDQRIARGRGAFSTLISHREVRRTPSPQRSTTSTALTTAAP